MDTSQILASVRNYGLQNPISNAVNAQLAQIIVPSIPDMITASIAQAAIAGVPAPSAGAITSAHDTIVSAMNAANSLIVHTNQLSGVDLNQSGTLSTIARTVIAARTINAEKSCSSIHLSFGALHKSDEMVSDTLAVIGKIQETISNLVQGLSEKVAVIASYASKITSQIAADLAAFAQAQQDLLEHALATSLVTLFDDECLSAIMGKIVTPILRTEIIKVRDKSFDDFKRARGI